MFIHGRCVCCGDSGPVDDEDGHCRACASGQCNHEDEDDARYDDEPPPDWDDGRDERDERAADEAADRYEERMNRRWER